MEENNDKQNKVSKIRQEIAKIIEGNDELKNVLLKDQNINDIFNNNLKLLNLNNNDNNKIVKNDSDDDYSVNSSDNEENDTQTNKDTDSITKSNSISKLLSNIDEYFSKLPPEMQKSIHEQIESGTLLQNNSDLKEDQQQNEQNQLLQQQGRQDADKEVPNLSKDADDESEAPNIEVELFPRTFPRRWNINTFAILHPSTESQYKPFVIPSFSSDSENEDISIEKSSINADNKSEETANTSENLIQQQNKSKRKYMRIDLDSLHFDGLPPGVHSDITKNSTMDQVTESSTLDQNQNSEQVTTTKSNYGINNYKFEPSSVDNSTMKEQMTTMLNRLEIDKYMNSLSLDSTQNTSQPPNQLNTPIPKEAQPPAPQSKENDIIIQEGPIDPMNDPNYFPPPDEAIDLPQFTLNDPEPSSDDSVAVITEDQGQQQPEQSQQQQQNQPLHTEQANAVTDRFLNTLSQKFGQQNINNDHYVQLVSQLRLQQQKLPQQTQSQPQQQQPEAKQQPYQQIQQPQQQPQPQQQIQQPQQQMQQPQQQIQQIQQQIQQPQQQIQQPQQQIQQPPQQQIQQPPQQQQKIQQQQSQQARLQLVIQPSQQQQQPVILQPVQQSNLQPQQMQSPQSPPIALQPVVVQPVPLQPIPMSPINQQFIPVAPVPQSFIQAQPIAQQYVQLQPVQQQFIPFQPMPQQFIPVQPSQSQSQLQQQPQAVSVPQSHFQQPSQLPEQSQSQQSNKSITQIDSATAQMQRLKQAELEKARQEYFQRVQNQNKQYEKLISVEKFSTDVLNKQAEKLFGDDGKFKEKLADDTQSGPDLFKKFPKDLNRFVKIVPYHEPKQKKMIELKGVLEDGEKTNQQQNYDLGSDDGSIQYFQDNDLDN